jgi:hypothetical protein
MDNLRSLNVTATPHQQDILHFLMSRKINGEKKQILAPLTSHAYLSEISSFEAA